MHLGYDIALDNTPYVHIESRYNVTDLLTVTDQEASWQKGSDTAAAGNLDSHLRCSASPGSIS